MKQKYITIKQIEKLYQKDVTEKITINVTKYKTFTGYGQINAKEVLYSYWQNQIIVIDSETGIEYLFDRSSIINKIPKHVNQNWQKEAQNVTK